MCAICREKSLPERRSSENISPRLQLGFLCAHDHFGIASDEQCANRRVCKQILVDDGFFQYFS